MRPNDLLLVIVPYRDRPEHLRVFLRDVWGRLRARHRDARMRLIVAEQSADGRLFNRGALLNAAVDYARDLDPARILFHDVDLVPCPRLLRLYRTMPLACRAVAYGQRWGRYPGHAYFGGVVGICPELFERCGGFASIWGWGGEDDALRRRIRGVRVAVPRVGSYRDLENLSLRGKLRELRHDATMSTREARREARGCVQDVKYYVEHREQCDDHERVVFDLE